MRQSSVCVVRSSTGTASSLCDGGCSEETRKAYTAYGKQPAFGEELL
jgi:hypothetical protein